MADRAPLPGGVRTMTVAEDEAEIRLDRWFRRHFPNLGHGRLEKLLRTGQVRVDGKRVKASRRLAVGEIVRIPPLGEGAAATKASPPPPSVSEDDARALRQRVLYRDDAMIALDKPSGLAVQGGSRTTRHLDAMLDALRFGARERPRLVHRLDKDTSGVLVLARTAVSARDLTRAFRARDARKLYWVLVVGRPARDEGRIDVWLAKRGGRGNERMASAEPGSPGAQRAVTLYRVVDRAADRAVWLAVMPLTGRTHQIRAHLAAIGTPVLGDGKYGGQDAFVGGLSKMLHLHARRLILPRPNGPALDVSAPLPSHMKATWEAFGFDPELDQRPFAEDEIA